ncbi:MAG TPA: hypothetical protein VGB77_12625 [Abditibacteriaceae bacterium]|jgi:hypothetical protein
MTQNKILLGGLGVLMLIGYNASQPGLREMRTMASLLPPESASKEEKKDALRIVRKQRYGPDLQWLDRLRNSTVMTIDGVPREETKLDFGMMSSLMLAGLASGFKSQVANLLWMKSDEYWHKGMLTRQNPIMEAVVTLDPQFLEAWDTAGWHWAYNIFADLPTQRGLEIKDEMSPAEKMRREKELRIAQDRAVDTGLRYYARGTQMNPDKYMLWFKFGWTRAEKAGYNDENTVNLYRTAREQPDARNQEMTVPDPKNPGKTKQQIIQGMDLMGRTIGHAYERMPHIAKALDTYAEILQIQDKPQERALLREAGRYWARYSSLYDQIPTVYNESDPVTKAQIRRLIPDIDRLLAAQKMRDQKAAWDKGQGSQPTGAYVSICARYLPAWELWQAGKLDQATQTIVGVMNSDPRYHLQGWPVMAKILEFKGDSPQAIAAQKTQQMDYEAESSQEMGLHMLARIFEAKAEKETDPARKKALHRIAYETWYRARERDSLNFQARRMTLQFEDKYGFTAPQAIVKQVRDSRRAGGTVDARPKSVPRVEDFINKPNDAPYPVTTPTPASAAKSPPPSTAPATAPAAPAPSSEESGHEGHNH